MFIVGFFVYANAKVITLLLYFINTDFLDSLDISKWWSSGSGYLNYPLI